MYQNRANAESRSLWESQHLLQTYEQSLSPPLHLFVCLTGVQVSGSGFQMYILSPLTGLTSSL